MNEETHHMISKGASYSVEALAYLGDSVFEVVIRTMLTGSGLSFSGELNKAALSYVTAPNQAKAADNILPILTDDELSFFRRGKNHKNPYHPKNCPPEAYRAATGLEVLLACLYLDGKYSRIEELIKAGFPYTPHSIK